MAIKMLSLGITILFKEVTIGFLFQNSQGKSTETSLSASGESNSTNPTSFLPTQDSPSASLTKLAIKHWKETSDHEIDNFANGTNGLVQIMKNVTIIGNSLADITNGKPMSRVEDSICSEIYWEVWKNHRVDGLEEDECKLWNFIYFFLPFFYLFVKESTFMTFHQ